MIKILSFVREIPSKLIKFSLRFSLAFSLILGLSFPAISHGRCFPEKGKLPFNRHESQRACKWVTLPLGAGIMGTSILTPLITGVSDKSSPEAILGYVGAATGLSILIAGDHVAGIVSDYRKWKPLLALQRFVQAPVSDPEFNAFYEKLSAEYLLKTDPLDRLEIQPEMVKEFIQIADRLDLLCPLKPEAKSYATGWRNRNYLTKDEIKDLFIETLIERRNRANYNAGWDARWDEGSAGAEGNSRNEVHIGVDEGVADSSDEETRDLGTEANVEPNVDPHFLKLKKFKSILRNVPFAKEGLHFSKEETRKLLLEVIQAEENTEVPHTAANLTDEELLKKAKRMTVIIHPDKNNKYPKLAKHIFIRFSPLLERWTELSGS